MGSLYRQKGRDGTPSGPWWIKYYVNDRPIRESTGTTNRKAAERVLKTKEGAAASGAPIVPRIDRTRYEEIARDLERHYEAHKTRDIAEYRRRVLPLSRFFARWRVKDIGQPAVDQYVVKRLEDGVVGATIRRELSTLVKMLRLAYKNNKVARLPLFDKPKDGTPRSGFFEDAQYHAVRRHLPADLQVAVTIAHTYGWRMQSEILTLERRQVDLGVGTLRLDPGSTKNNDARVVYLTPELKSLIAAQVERVRAVERKTGRIIPFLFPFLSGPIRRGQRRGDFRKTWTQACKAAGVPGGLRHDFRRTAVRNLERAGVPRSVAMKITGHKTENVYRRYAIVADADLREATARLAAGITAGITSPAGLTGAP
jgi:integrase